VTLASSPTTTSTTPSTLSSDRVLASSHRPLQRGGFFVAVHSIQLAIINASGR
jgi:hypothetical protein